MIARSEEAHDLLASMLRIRLVEETLAEKYAEQEMRCPMHLCIGQEAIAVGVSKNLGRDDAVLSNHRAHGHYLAKGGDLRSMIAEIYGRPTGCCAGRGGSMHLLDRECGFLGSTPIVGGTVPVAVGVAWSFQLRGSNSVAVVYFGDGCFEEGVVHESLNFAAMHGLPVMFVCENNDFSVYTKLSDRQPDRPIFKVAESHGLFALSGDGNDLEAVLNLSELAQEAARNGRPSFVEFSTYRWREHCGPNFDNELGYRTNDEVVEGLSRCPIDTFISKNNIGDGLVQSIRESVMEEINEVFSSVQSEVPIFDSLSPSSVYAVDKKY